MLAISSVTSERWTLIYGSLSEVVNFEDERTCLWEEAGAAAGASDMILGDR